MISFMLGCAFTLLVLAYLRQRKETAKKDRKVKQLRKKLFACTERETQ